MKTKNEKAASSNTRHILVLPDMHVKSVGGRVAGVDLRSLDAVLKYTEARRPWHGVVLIGDFLDMNCISSHNKDNLRAVEGELLSADYEAGKKVLGMLDQALGLKPGAPKILLEGNHEYRVERLINANPRLQGLVEVPKNLELKKTGWGWVPSWSEGKIYRIGKAAFSHGIYHSKYHAFSHADAFGCNLFYGHTHDVQSFSLSTRTSSSPRLAQSLGCLCVKQHYMRGRPSRHQQAFGEFFFLPSGIFNHYVPLIFNNQFVGLDGKIWKG